MMFFVLFSISGLGLVLVVTLIVRTGRDGPEQA